MRTTLIAAALTLLAVLAAMLYHLRAVDSWADRLRAEQSAHTQTRADLTACKSASRAACAVAQAVDGTADAEQALGGLIKERSQAQKEKSK